ncbi:MAG: carbohydrate porin [Dehalococcoidia bacterium]
MRFAARLGAVLALLISSPVRSEDDCGAGCPAWRFDVAYIGDVLSNASGGAERGTSYLDNLDLSLEVDGQRLIGVQGLKLFAYVIYNNGNAFSGELAGDAQGVSNIEADRAVRVMEAWADFTLPSQSSLRIGLYDLNSEYDTTETGGLFLNASHGIGPDFAQSGRNGPSIFPTTGLAARLRHEFSNGVAAQALFAEGTPGDPTHPRRTTIRFDRGEGLLLAAELQAAAGAFTKLALGGWRYTARFDDLLLTQLDGGAVRRRGNRGAYALAESTLLKDAAGDARLTGFLRVGIAEGSFNAFDQYIGTGIAWAGLVRGRPDDQLGLAVASVRNGRQFREAMSLAGTPVGARETNVELTYRLVASDWLVLQPDLQYIVSPGMRPGVRDALILGLRFELSWGIER